MWQVPSAFPFQTNSLIKSLGQWGGMPIIAIGPRGGKIVGYGSDGKPIYGGSPKAQQLAALRAAPRHHKTAQQQHIAIKAWMQQIGFPVKIEDDDVLVTPESGKLLLDSYGTKPHSTGSLHWKFKIDLEFFRPKGFIRMT